MQMKKIQMKRAHFPLNPQSASRALKYKMMEFNKFIVAASFRFIRSLARLLVVSRIQ